MFFYCSNVIDLSTTAPLFTKEGLREILRNAIKVPLYPPLYPEGHKIKGDLKDENH
jgi:hypothetical protein